jgi:hypothetical protein
VGQEADGAGVGPEKRVGQVGGTHESCRVAVQLGAIFSLESEMEAKSWNGLRHRSTRSILPLIKVLHFCLL